MHHTLPCCCTAAYLTLPRYTIIALHVSHHWCLNTTVEIYDLALTLY